MLQKGLPSLEGKNELFVGKRGKKRLANSSQTDYSADEGQSSNHKGARPKRSLTTKTNKNSIETITGFNSTNRKTNPNNTSDKSFQSS